MGTTMQQGQETQHAQLTEVGWLVLPPDSAKRLNLGERSPLNYDATRQMIFLGNSDTEYTLAEFARMRDEFNATIETSDANPIYDAWDQHNGEIKGILGLSGNIGGQNAAEGTGSNR